MNIKLPENCSCSVAIIGLGYVGLPLALQINSIKKSFKNGEVLTRKVIGFDINKERLKELKAFNDKTNELNNKELKILSEGLTYTSNENLLSEIDIFIVTVPTPIKEDKTPDMFFIKNASSIVGRALSKRKSKINPIIVFESTVYPGATEEICLPIIKRESRLNYEKTKNLFDFYIGYSPERINPGDKYHTLNNITKVVSGCNEKVSAWLVDFYGSFIEAGTYLASSIKIAEAAKIIENTQRDLNIALINELSIIFSKLGIDTLDVIETASTKWNFAPFKPGLVGGHCIGVDPYYLTYKAKKLGYIPKVVLAGREINDDMSHHLCNRLLKIIEKKGLSIKGAEILILGATFKENCPDIRNTKVLNLIKELEKFNPKITLVDPVADNKSFEEKHTKKLLKTPPKNKKFLVVMVIVAHKQFLDYDISTWEELKLNHGILFDLKGIIPRELNPYRI